MHCLKNTQEKMTIQSHTLYALHFGLCSMVEAGNIDKDRAVKIFEGMRGTVIQQYKDYDSAEGNRKGKI